tara:strand:- start:129 stop:401 length:273 start_codon:yes stop_codon:yes gene_type:complete
MKFTKSQLKQVILETLEEAKHRYASDPTDYKNQIAGKIVNVIKEKIEGVDPGLAQETAYAIMSREPLSDIITKHIYGFALKEEKEDLSNE